MVRRTPYEKLWIFLLALAVTGCALKAREGYAPTSAKTDDTEAAPPPHAAEPLNQGIPETVDAQKQVIQRWSRNLAWHGRQLGVTVRPLANNVGEAGPDGNRSPSPVMRSEGSSPAPRAREAPARVRSYKRSSSPKDASSGYKATQKKTMSRRQRCVKACRHAEAICRAADKICRIAEELNEPAAYTRCTWGKAQCKRARAAVRKRCGDVCG